MWVWISSWVNRGGPGGLVCRYQRGAWGWHDTGIYWDEVSTMESRCSHHPSFFTQSVSPWCAARFGTWLVWNFLHSSKYHFSFLYSGLSSRCLGCCNLSPGFLNTWECIFFMKNYSNWCSCRGTSAGNSSSAILLYPGTVNILNIWTGNRVSMDYIDWTNRWNWWQKPSINIGVKQILPVMPC